MLHVFMQTTVPVTLHQKLCSGILLIILCIFCSTARAAEQHINVIQLNNASTEELLPVIESQLGEGSSVSAYQNQIILNATDAETTAIKNLINTLDGASKQLLVSVKNSNSSTINSTGGDIRQNNGSQLSASLQQRSIINSGLDQQGIRVTEGYPSYITTGSSRAYSQPVISSNGNIVQNQQWQNAMTGFYATCYVNGDEISIKIEQQKQRFNSSQSINTQQLQTRVSGKLGEWIPVGNLNSQNTHNSNSLNSINHNRDMQNNTIFLKVELAE